MQSSGETGEAEGGVLRMSKFGCSCSSTCLGLALGLPLVISNVMSWADCQVGFLIGMCLSSPSINELLIPQPYVPPSTFFSFSDTPPWSKSCLISRCPFVCYFRFSLSPFAQQSLFLKHSSSLLPIQRPI